MKALGFGMTHSGCGRAGGARRSLPRIARPGG